MLGLQVCKVCGPYVDTFLNRMPTFEYILCIMAQLLIKNGHQKDISYDEIGLCAHNLSIILGSILITQLRRPL